MSVYLSYESCPSCSGKAQPGTVDLLKYLMNRFPSTYSLGVYNCRLPSLHSCGKALDLGIPLIGGNANTAIGDAVVRFLDQFANEFGLMGQIWNRVRYDLKTPKGRVYTGPHPHHDHNHVEQRLWHAQNLRYADYVRIAGDPIGGDQVLDRNSPKPSSAVAMYQRDLIYLGYDLGDWPSIQPSLYPPGADGSFGDDAEAGTKKFQADMEIQVTGKGDALTVTLAANLARFNQIREVAAKAGNVTGGLTQAQADKLYQALGTIPGHGHKYAPVGHGHKGTVIEKHEVELT